MENTSKDSLVTNRDIAYYRQRQKNRVYSALASFFAEEAEHGRISKRELAERLGKDPAQITRWLTAPSNFELDTISDLLLAMGAEMDHNIIRFSERSKPNYVHPLMPNKVPQYQELKRPARITSTASPKQTIVIETAPSGINIKSEFIGDGM